MQAKVSIDALYSYLESLAPNELAEEWDNCGLLVRSGNEVSKVLVALDINSAVCDEAIRLGCEVIVSHHPVIFAPITHIGENDVVAKLIRNNISAICMHTNLDLAKGGVNDVLAQELCLDNIEPMAPIGAIGSVKAPLSCKALAQLSQDKLGKGIRYTDIGKDITRVAVVGGAGGEYISAARAAGAECLITGEAKYHEAQYAQTLGISLIVAGHYATEKPVCAYLAAGIKAKFAQLSANVSAQGRDIFEYL